MTSKIALQVMRDLYNGFMSHAREYDTMHVLLEDDLGRLTLDDLATIAEQATQALTS